MIFNLRPYVAVGEHFVYCIQRNEEGLYVELVKHSFVDNTSDVIYKCQPFNELKISRKNEGWEQVLVEER